MKLTFRAMILSICLTICAFAQVPAGDARTGTTESTTAAARLDKMPRDLEVRYALSALPPHLRDAATTYVLDPDNGYVLNRKGTSGFSCFGARTALVRFPDEASLRKFWNSPENTPMKELRQGTATSHVAMCISVPSDNPPK